MGLYTLLFLLGLAFIGYKKEGTLFNLQTLFCIVWGCMSYAASFRLYGMINFSNQAYYAVILGCLGFSFGYLFKATPNIKNEYVEKLNNSYIINQNGFNLIYWITTIFMLYFAIKVVMLLMAGFSYSLIRDMFTYENEDSVLTSKFDLYIQFFIVYASVPVYTACLVLHFLRIIDLSRFQLTQIIVLLLIFVFVSGSRITITNAIIQMVLLFFMLGIRIEKKYVRNIIVIIGILLYSISVITEGRLKESAIDRGVTEETTYYQYGTLSLPMCDYYMKMADNNGDRTYGTYFVSGFANCIFRPLGLIGVPKPDIFKTCDRYNESISEYIPIFEGGVNNAFASIFFYFYLDFGFGGVFFLMLIFGSLVKMFYLRCFYRRDLRSTLLFTILLIAVIKSFARWEFVTVPYCLSFVYIFLITKYNPEWNRVKNLI